MRKFITPQTQADIKNVDTIVKLEAALISVCKNYLEAYSLEEKLTNNHASFWIEIQDRLAKLLHTNQINASKIINRLHDYSLMRHWPVEDKIITLKEPANSRTTKDNQDQAVIIFKNLETIVDLSGYRSLNQEIVGAIYHNFYRNIDTATQSDPLLRSLIELRIATIVQRHERKKERD